MRINFIAPRGLPQTGGVEYHIHYLANSLAELGNEVSVHSQVTPNDSLEQTMLAAQYRQVRYPLKVNTYYGINSNLVKEALSLLKAGETVHLQAAHKPLAATIALLAWRRYDNLIFTPHYHGGGHSAIANLAHKVYRVFLSFALRNVGIIIAVSESEAEILKSHFPHAQNRVTIIPNGTSEPNTYSKDDAKQFLVVSRLEKYKNIDKVIANLPEEASLTIVGEGPDLSRLKELARGKDVDFKGNLSEEELDSVWANSKTLVSLSEHEAYGMVAAEALARGLNVVLSDIPAHRYVWMLSGQDAKMIFVEDGSTISAALSHALADKNSRIPNLFYSWSKTSEETQQLYNSGAKL
jgi:1,2-diacylglycerol 3-alpha-glucosyltransferase